MHAVPVQRQAVHSQVREVNRLLRGHDFLPNQPTLAMIPCSLRHRARPGEMNLGRWRPR